MHIPTITPRRIVSTCLSVGIVLANTELVTSGMPFSLSPSVPATRDTVAATLALFDGDADEATVVAPLMALRQDPVWMLSRCRYVRASQTGSSRRATRRVRRAGTYQLVLSLNYS